MNIFNRKEKKVKLFWKVGMTYATIQYLKRPYRCLPVSRWLNVSELKKSLEKETFQKIEPQI